MEQLLTRCHSLAQAECGGLYSPNSLSEEQTPYGIKYNKTWLINSIQSHCSVPFTMVDAQFFIQDARAASALKDINYKICDEENQKLSIHVNPSAVPYSVQNKLEPEEMEQLKTHSGSHHISLQLTMSKCYDISQKALDLHKLYFDPSTTDSSNSGGLPGRETEGCLLMPPLTFLKMDHDIDIILN
ncbi:hypothetical protein GH733_018977 [Mirounga leonina]|nr:hypothetical protein GH733_018977 [Mirounga leonina]